MNPLPTKAMLLAAGLGERLRPLTLTLPKPLIPVAGRPLIEYNLALLKKFGVREVMINLFHLGDKIRDSLGDGSKYGLSINYSEEKTLLGTGGGAKAAEKFFGQETFYLLNADILIDLDLKALFDLHVLTKATATLALHPSKRSDIRNWVFVDGQNRIREIGETAPVSPPVRPMIFTGVQILGPDVLQTLPPTGKSCIVQDAYLPLLRRGKTLSGYVTNAYWRDLGTPERYEEVKKEFEKGWPYTALSPEDFTSV
ncbi:MAG: nucleotidyltransferase family protein [bacterium]